MAQIDGLSLGEEGPCIQMDAMAGFFAAIVRAPLTATALIIEITGALHCFTGVLYISFASHIAANFIHSLPIYESLKQHAYYFQSVKFSYYIIKLPFFTYFFYPISSRYTSKHNQNQ